ncbi:hypothetical protein DsansV1_C25g0187411 [Dioscorea sansibarensis]
MGKRRAKKRLDLLTSDQTAAPQEVPRKRGRPRKVIAVKEKADNKPDETAEEQQQQQQEASSSRDAGKDEEKAIQEQNQEEEKPSSSRGRRKSRKPLKST